MPSEKQTTEKKSPAKKADKKPYKIKDRQNVKDLTTPQKVEKQKKLAPTAFVCGLLMERKYTDQDIFLKASKEYPVLTEKQIKVYISVQRTEINRGNKKKFRIASDEEPITKIIVVDGKKIQKTTESEKKTAATRKTKSKPEKKAAPSKKKQSVQKPSLEKKS